VAVCLRNTVAERLLGRRTLAKTTTLKQKLKRGVARGDSVVKPSGEIMTFTPSDIRIDTRAFALASGLLWGTAILVVSAVHEAKPRYGGAFLEVLRSVYPYRARGGSGEIVSAAGLALLDGALAGATLACLYNALSHRTRGPELRRKIENMLPV
jgi:hypothetical protein